MTGEPDVIAERDLATVAVGDLCVVEGCGAYVSGMSAKNYNSFPEAPEVMIDETGGLHLIRRRQSLEQVCEVYLLEQHSYFFAA
jgi:diaminopimelate decarboxylase